MQEILASLRPLEVVGVASALAYLLLAARQSLWCWLCALVSSLIYMYLMWQSQLFMETALNFFYAVMAIIGWQQWVRGGEKHEGVAIISFSWRQHLLCLAFTLLLTFANGWLMQRYTAAAWPFVDSFITWGSVLTTFLVVRKVLENWLYWVLLDGIAVFVYIDRGLYLTALLFMAYVVIVILGYFNWRRQYLQLQAAVAIQN
jgi:nicotinamide mononucleotide transporter